ncbi:hypothetical protein CcCBS67573_g01390 [Chytriomyces confervae]|uniref:Uncharacterized protein n=1 Tax=Chytriomyces confervae TaxID=246404 RepID=A0A507FPR8_9FUNG|nr:hypothetical protein HDU80_004362 [Chytriomyces hyalinus]TPX77326.1 hypothetical protein CcCBS67573_g01390 [Chytriomyces confervae]
MAHVYELAARLRHVVSEFREVSDEMFVEVVSGGSAAAAVRGRQRILATLMERMGADGIAKLIDARKAELRLEIKRNLSAEEKRANEHSFNALFAKICVRDLDGLGFTDWSRAKNSGRPVDPSSNAWFVEAVQFMLRDSSNARNSAAGSPVSSPRQNPVAVSSARAPRKAETKPPALEKQTRASAKSVGAPSQRATANEPQRIAQALRVSSSNLKLNSQTDTNAALVADLEAQLRDTRRECATLKNEIAGLQELLAQKMILESPPLQTNKSVKRNTKDAVMDSRSAEFLKMQSLQMMRHVFEIRELMIRNKST